METVSYRMIEGYMVIPGMLFWLDKKTDLIGKLVVLQPEEGEPEGMVFEVPFSGFSHASTTRFNPLYLDTPEPHRRPDEFKHLISREVSGVKFTVGEYVYFPDETAFRQLTGHAEPKCIGYLTMISEEGELYAGFIANPNGKKPVKFLLKVEPQEVEAIVERIPVGQRGLRIRTRGVDGEQEHNLQPDFRL